VIKLNLNELNVLNKEKQKYALKGVNKKLESMSAEQRIVWSLDNLLHNAVLSSSFGIQAAVSLHMITCHKPDIPVIFTDTGYMFKETYNFIDKLKEKLNINLNIFSAKESPAWQEARYGKLWEKGLEGIKLYNDINKVESINYFRSRYLVCWITT